MKIFYQDDSVHGPVSSFDLYQVQFNTDIEIDEIWSDDADIYGSENFIEFCQEFEKAHYFCPHCGYMFNSEVKPDDGDNVHCPECKEFFTYVSTLAMPSALAMIMLTNEDNDAANIAISAWRYRNDAEKPIYRFCDCDWSEARKNDDCHELSKELCCQIYLIMCLTFYRVISPLTICDLRLYLADKKWNLCEFDKILSNEIIRAWEYVCLQNKSLTLALQDLQKTIDLLKRNIASDTFSPLTNALLPLVHDRILEDLSCNNWQDYLYALNNAANQDEFKLLSIIFRSKSFAEKIIEFSKYYFTQKDVFCLQRWVETRKIIQRHGFPMERLYAIEKLSNITNSL